MKDIFIYDYSDKKFKYTGFFPKKIAEHLESNGVALTKNILDPEVV